MSILNFFYTLFSGGKLKCQHYFDDTKKEINLPSMAINIDIIKECDVKGELGQINTSRKISVPSHISEKLVQLDQNQYNLANAINALPKNERSESIKEYIQILLEIHKTISNEGGETSLNKQNGDIGNSNIGNNNKNLKKFLDDRHFKSSALPDNLNKNQGYIIWPVALLAKTTYIHKAQAQLIKLLTDCGWKLLVIIGDCGKDAAKRDLPGFMNGIKQILSKQGIPFYIIAKISDYYQQDDTSPAIGNNLIKGITGTKILKSFHNISEGLKWEEFDKLIKKNYDETKKEEIKQRNVLHNIQPLLIWSLVATIVKESHSKAIVIAGEDEKVQWDYITNNHTENNLGVIYIHELKKEGDKTMDQEDIQIGSIQEMRNKLHIGNMAEWLYTHFVELPKFTTKQKPVFCKLSTNLCERYHDNCINCLFREGNNFNSTDFDKNQFVDIVYPMSNPAN